ncbi:hypothetical protein O181_023177 [Austropuccinia psidii MF-1]|uniref:Uncharacterized protein n=1 Tax=Austropuccinia psidii MF-1 TaxID=1389203 RepID=A0A9Q3GXT3_9BASI|nr:hypothetical protein [Austropuccinia psidii MF-1]
MSTQYGTIPAWPGINSIEPPIPTISGNLSPPTNVITDKPIIVNDSECPLSPSCICLPQKKFNSYLPHYRTAPKDISSNIIQCNLIPTPLLKKDPPEEMTSLTIG